MHASLFTMAATKLSQNKLEKRAKKALFLHVMMSFGNSRHKPVQRQEPLCVCIKGSILGNIISCFSKGFDDVFLYYFFFFAD